MADNGDIELKIVRDGGDAAAAAAPDPVAVAARASNLKTLHRRVLSHVRKQCTLRRMARRFGIPFKDNSFFEIDDETTLTCTNMNPAAAHARQAAVLAQPRRAADGIVTPHIAAKLRLDDESVKGGRASLSEIRKTSHLLKAEIAAYLADPDAHSDVEDEEPSGPQVPRKKRGRPPKDRPASSAPPPAKRAGPGRPPKNPRVPLRFMVADVPEDLDACVHELEACLRGQGMPPCDEGPLFDPDATDITSVVRPLILKLKPAARLQFTTQNQMIDYATQMLHRETAESVNAGKACAHTGSGFAVAV